MGLLVSLVICAGLVAAATAVYRIPWLGSLGLLAGYTFFTFSCLGALLPSMTVVYALVATAWVLARWRNLAPTAFAGLGAGAVLLSYAVAAYSFIPRWREIQRLAGEYPVVNMAERLDYERRSGFAPPGEAKFVNPADDLSGRIEQARSDRPYWRDSRIASLASLERTHDNFVEAFSEQEGFGFPRLGPLPARAELIELEASEPMSLPSLPPLSTSAGDVEETASLSLVAGHAAFHRAQVVNFANPAGFGYALDGEWSGYGPVGATRVRGFQPHAFREMPKAAPAGDDWQLARLGLVSLLKHDPPAVYLSNHLPRMQELSSDFVPTRPLDAFESASLAQLVEGKAVVAEEGRYRIRMLGGMRAAQQCTQCHSVGEGHLLGAFSYEFRRKNPLPPAEPKAARPVL